MGCWATYSGSQYSFLVGPVALMDASRDQADKHATLAHQPRHGFQRTIVLNAHPGRVHGRVEDNVHDFSVAIIHDGLRVQKVLGGARRVPWTSCPLAVGSLHALVGAPLAGGGPRIDPGQQCTHLFDLARLAIAQASRGGTRRYDVVIAAEASVRAARAQLWRDGSLILDWRLEDDLVTAGDLFVGHTTSGRAIWPAGVDLRPDLIEAGLVLRRCLLVFRGRQRGDSHVAMASDLPHMAGTCFSFDPKRSAQAVRPDGFIDYAEAPIEDKQLPPAKKSIGVAH